MPHLCREASGVLCHSIPRSLRRYSTLLSYHPLLWPNLKHVEGWLQPREGCGWGKWKNHNNRIKAILKIYSSWTRWPLHETKRVKEGREQREKRRVWRGRKERSGRKTLINCISRTWSSHAGVWSMRLSAVFALSSNLLLCVLILPFIFKPQPSLHFLCHVKVKKKK